MSAPAPQNLSKTLPSSQYFPAVRAEPGFYFAVDLLKLGFEVGAPSIVKPTFNVTWKWLTLPSLMCPLVRATSNHLKCLMV